MVTINTPAFTEVIINIIVRYYNLLNLIVISQRLLFTSRFWLLLCYFFDIKQKLSTAFHLQINSQTKKQNNKIEAYLQAFINFQQNNQTQRLLITKFTYNNTKNASIGYMSFELNCKYHLYVSDEKYLNFCSKLKSIKELFFKLQKLIIIC